MKMEWIFTQCDKCKMMKNVVKTLTGKYICKECQDKFIELCNKQLNNISKTVVRQNE